MTKIAEMTTVVVETGRRGSRGRPSSIADKFAVVDLLKAIADNTENRPSRFIARRLEERGLVAFNQQPATGRGRPRVKIELTGKGKSYIALSQRWNRPAE